MNECQLPPIKYSGFQHNSSVSVFLCGFSGFSEGGVSGVHGHAEVVEMLLVGGDREVQRMSSKHTTAIQVLLPRAYLAVLI